MKGFVILLLCFALLISGVTTWLSVEMGKHQAAAIQAQTELARAQAAAIEAQALAVAELIRAQAANLNAQNFVLYAAGLALLGMGAAVVILALTVARVHRQQVQQPVYLPRSEVTQLQPGSSLVIVPDSGFQLVQREMVERR